MMNGPDTFFEIFLDPGTGGFRVREADPGTAGMARQEYNSRLLEVLATVAGMKLSEMHAEPRMREAMIAEINKNIRKACGNACGDSTPHVAGYTSETTEGWWNRPQSCGVHGKNMEGNGGIM